MFNKIQPQQFQLHTFSSPSGNFDFTQTETDVKVNLHTGQTGSFNLEGSLFINGGKANSSHSSNTFLGTATAIGAGQSHFVSGTDSAVLAGATNEVSGSRNVIVNGNQGQILETASDGTILAGYGGLIISGHDGAVVLADSRVETKQSIKTNTLNIDFENGAYMQNSLIVNDDIEAGGSGLFSGDFNVLGQMFYDGSEIATNALMTGFVSGVSGVLTGRLEEASGVLSSFLELTGQSLDQRIIYDLDNLVRKTGEQTITGDKTFLDDIRIGPEVVIRGTGATFNSIIIEDDQLVDITTGKCLTLTSLDSVACLLDTDTNNAPSIHENDFAEQGGTWNSSFVVATGTADPDTSLVRFGVHPSGIGWFKDSLILDLPTYIPSAASDAGTRGHMVWDRVDSDLTHIYLNNGTEWVRFSGVSW